METLLDGLPEQVRLARAASPSPFQAWLSGRIDGHRDDQNWLDHVPLYAAAEFCEAAGLSSQHEPKVQTSTLDPAQWAAAADEGYGIISAGEASLRALLERLNEAQLGTRGTWAPRDSYGYAYVLLQRTMEDPADEKRRDAVRRFAFETMPLTPGAELLGQVLDRQVVHTIHTASEASGAHARTMRRLFSKKGYPQELDDLTDHRVTVSLARIEEMVTALKGH